MPNYLRGLPSRSKEYNRRQFVTRLSTALDEMEQKSRMAQWDEALGSPLSPAEQDFAQRRMPVADTTPTTNTKG